MIAVVGSQSTGIIKVIFRKKFIVGGYHWKRNIAEGKRCSHTSAYRDSTVPDQSVEIIC